MNDMRPEPAKWWVVAGLVVLVGLAAGVQGWRELQKPAAPERLHARYVVGQRWFVSARSHETHATITVVHLERHPVHGVIVHVRVDGLRLVTPRGVLDNIAHLPFTPAAIDASIVGLDSTNGALGAFHAPMEGWRAAGAPPIRTDVRDGIIKTEMSMNW